MARMIRKQVYIEREQDAVLKRLAAEWGLTESELIRRGIEALARTAADRPLDDAAWEEELAFMEELARTVPPTGGKRDWTREELYDDRLNRLSR